MEIIDFILSIDVHLANVISALGGWTYVVLFLVIFAETGLVVAPFLPGDSLLFAAGALAGGDYLNIWAIYFLLLGAAILGDTINYWVGRKMGPKIFSKENSRIFNKSYIEKTREFYAKHGGKTIVFARFLPILRTFAPFVAGIGNMHYKKFLFFNVLGGFVWVTSFTFAGYFFGGLPFIKENFEYAILLIIALSLLPMILEYFKHKKGAKVTKKQLEHATYQDIQKTLKEEHLND